MQGRNRRRKAGASVSTVAVKSSSNSSPGSFSNKRQHVLLFAVLLSAFTLLLYSNSFRVPMILDNRGMLEDPRIRAATSENLALIWDHTYWWPTGESGLYRPFTTLSYLFNYAILGNAARPNGYHVINWALHLANVLLVFAIGRALLLALPASALLAGLWAAHPVSTESVTNIVGRSDLLAAMSILAGLLLYLKSTQSGGALRFVYLVSLGLVTAMGVFSKESAVTIAGLIVLYELAWPDRRRWRDLALGLAATGIPIAAMLIQRASVLASSPPAEFPFTDNPIVYASFFAGRLTALKVATSYLLQALWPWRLSIDYSYSQIPLTTDAGAWIYLAIVPIAAAAFTVLWRVQRRAFFLAGFAVLAFLPVSNMLFPIGTIRADRFLYLPTVGVLGCFVIAVYSLASRAKIPLAAPAVLLCLTAAFAGRTWTRNSDWRDELTLASTDVQISPRSFKLHQLIGATLFNADPSHANVDRVVQEFDQGLAILNALPDALNTPRLYDFAGAAYLVKGDRLQSPGAPEARDAYQRARELLQKCIQINEAYKRDREMHFGQSGGGMVPRSEAEAYRQLAIADQRLGDMDAALQAARSAQRLAPGDPQFYSQIANLLLMRHEGDRAATAYMEGLLITSDRNLRDELVRLYGSSPSLAGCALVNGPNGPGINPNCEIVRKHVCAAAPEVLKTLTAMGRGDDAAKDKQMFENEYQCPPGSLQ